MMDDKKKKIADKLIKYMEELLEDEDPLYEDDELFEKVKKPKIKVMVSKKLKEKAE
jgi:hypothetical protein